MGGGQDRRLAQVDDEQYAQDMEYQLMDDVQFGRPETPRVPIPLRGLDFGPPFDPKDVPVFYGPHHKEFDPKYGTSELRYLAGGGQSDNTALFDALRRLLIQGKGGGSYG